jgi:hypothetical protein
LLLLLLLLLLLVVVVVVVLLLLCRGRRLRVCSSPPAGELRYAPPIAHLYNST